MGTFRFRSFAAAVVAAAMPAFASPLNGQIIVGYGVPYPYGIFGYGYNGGYGYYGGYPAYPYSIGLDWDDDYVLPPLVIPAETMYGPGQVRRMMGLDPPSSTSILTNPALQNRNNNQANNGAGPTARPNIRASNQLARNSAKRHLELGDDAFRRQQYGNAWMAYKESIRCAPDVADAYFHQAAAAVAQGRYEAAADAIRSGLRSSTAYVNGRFKYPELYGANRLAHTTHLEALAATATEQPSSDLYFLLGVMLFFDADPPRSAPFFERAEQLAVGDKTHINVFREVLRRMAANPANAAPAPAAQAPGDADGRAI